MRIVGNILWLIFGGFLSWLGWILSGAVWCITIIGIPVGVQCFKFAKLSLWPFGKNIRDTGGVMSILVNIIWVVIFGLPMALGNAAVGLVLCCTIIGIPFGLQFFKIARLALLPFGAEIYVEER